MSIVYVLGDNIAAITTATVMASLGHDVCIASPNDYDVDQVIQHYAFEYQLVALWQLYQTQQKITLCTLENIKLKAIQSASQDAYLWLFLDGFEKNHTKPNALINELKSKLSLLFDGTLANMQILMSGLVSLGEVNNLAKHLYSQNVFYVPFVFLQDGTTHASMLKPNLFLVGEKTKDSIKKLPLIAPLIKQAKHFKISDIKTVEFARSTMMAMLASRLSFINEMARLADAKNVNLVAVKDIMGLDERIGSSYIKPSWGFGGASLPKELDLLQHSFEKNNIDTQLVQAIVDINNDQKEIIFRKFWQYFDSFVQGKTVLIWGAGYKAGSGRTLNSAIHPLLNLLWQYDIQTKVYDFNASVELTTLYLEEKKMEIVASAYDALDSVDALFIINWPQPIRPDLSKLVDVNIPIFDAENLLNDAEIKQLKQHYIGIGRDYRPE